MVTVRLYFLRSTRLTVNTGKQGDFRLVGGRVGMTVRQDTTESVANISKWLGKKEAPDYITRCWLSATTPPPTVLIYELDIKTGSHEGDFDKADFANVVRMVEQRVHDRRFCNKCSWGKRHWHTASSGLAAVAVAHEDMHLVATCGYGGDIQGLYTWTRPRRALLRNQDTLDAHIISCLIPWTRKNYIWAQPAGYVTLMLPVPEELDKNPLHHDVRCISIWVAFLVEGYPRTPGFWPFSPIFASGAWFRAIKKLADDSWPYVPCDYSQVWKPAFPSTIRIIDDAAIVNEE
jgi:hypothetical protein